MDKSDEKTNTGEGGKGKRGRTASDDAGGKSLCETPKSARGQCVGESSTDARLTVIRTMKDKRRTKNNNLEFLIIKSFPT